MYYTDYGQAGDSDTDALNDSQPAEGSSQDDRSTHKEEESEDEEKSETGLLSQDI